MLPSPTTSGHTHDMVAALLLEVGQLLLSPMASAHTQHVWALAIGGFLIVRQCSAWLAARSVTKAGHRRRGTEGDRGAGYGGAGDACAIVSDVACGHR